MKHIVRASLLTVGVAALLLLAMRFLPILPGAATSSQGVLVDRLFHWETYVIAFIFALVIVFLLYGIVAFRRRPDDAAEGRPVRGNMPLELAWTIVPLIVVIAFAVVSARDLGHMLQDTPDELRVDVTAFQWGWKFYYPTQNITATELYLPRGRQVLLNITSLDVIHAFWVLEWRISQDAVPGQWHQLRITPLQDGNYTIRCNESCGFAHALMVAPAVVVEPAAFDAWIAQQQAQAQGAATASPAERGQQLWSSLGCKSCHSADGSPSDSPTFKGLFGSPVKLADGTTVVADDAYLAESIRSPTAKVVAGYKPVMPASYASLSDADVNALVEFIKSLK